MTIVSSGGEKEWNYIRVNKWHKTVSWNHRKKKKRMPQVVISMLLQKIRATTKKNNSKYWEIIQQRNEKDTVKNVFNKK